MKELTATALRAFRQAKEYVRRPQGDHFKKAPVWPRVTAFAATPMGRTVSGTALTLVLLAGVVGFVQPARPSVAGELICLPIYQVQRGDTMSGIAKKVGIPLDHLMVYNAGRWSVNDEASWDMVREGEVIYIGHPECENQSASATQPKATPAANVSTPDLPPGLLRAAEAAHNAGFRDGKLVTVLAVGGGESNFRPEAVGDTAIMNGKWGPSRGVWQIRTLNDGSDLHRSQAFLSESVTNQAIAAWEISGGGTNFQPWAAYTGPDGKGSNGSWHRYLPQAEQAAGWIETVRGT